VLVDVGVIGVSGVMGVAGPGEADSEGVANSSSRNGTVFAFVSFGRQEARVDVVLGLRVIAFGIWSATEGKN
jgi:hypothetical protein